MKKLMLLPAMLLLLFPTFSQAEEKGDRAVALKALSAHQASQKVFRTAPLPQNFIESWSEEAICVNSMVENIMESSMTEDDQVVYVFSVAILATFDYYISSSKNKSDLIQRQAAVLERKTKKIIRSAASKRGRAIGASLRGHKVGIVAFLRAKGSSFDFCQMETAITESGGYTKENIERAFEEALVGTWAEMNAEGGAFDKSLTRSEKLISRGQTAMSKVRPKIRMKRLERYGDLPNLSIGMSANRERGSLRSLGGSSKASNFRSALRVLAG